jgi:hypothetical protein
MAFDLGLNSYPDRLGYRPVMMAALEGAHVAEAAYALLKTTPCCAMESIFGV